VLPTPTWTKGPEGLGKIPDGFLDHDGSQVGGADEGCDSGKSEVSQAKRLRNSSSRAVSAGRIFCLKDGVITGNLLGLSVWSRCRVR